jgi:hypothetical protein
MRTFYNAQLRNVQIVKLNETLQDTYKQMCFFRKKYGNDFEGRSLNFKSFICCQFYHVKVSDALSNSVQ